jgi:hypothetical protein
VIQPSAFVLQRCQLAKVASFIGTGSPSPLARPRVAHIENGREDSTEFLAKFCLAERITTDQTQAFFAMPLFDWGASSMRGVMTDHFWIYWAVTGPLTILVMGIVIAFAIRQTRQQRRSLESALDGLSKHEKTTGIV